MSSNVENEGNENTGWGCESDKAKEVRDAFASLPFDQKVSTLLRVEFDMVEKMANTVMSEASKALDEIADAVMGTKRESTNEPGAGEQPAQP